MVFLFHLDLEIDWRPLHLFNFGQTAVAFFFVISGFVLTWSMRPNGRARDFYFRRFSRIYPSMLVMTLAAAVAVEVMPSLRLPTGVLGFTTALVAVQAWFFGSYYLYPMFAYDGVQWSLSVEAFFYAMFPVLVPRLARLSSRALVAGGTVIVLIGGGMTYALAHGGPNGMAFTNPIVRLPEFLLGAILALLMRKGWRPKIPVSVAVLVTVVSALAARKAPFFPAADYMMMPAFALLIVAATRADVLGKAGLLTTSSSVYLGRLSFAFYLTHGIAFLVPLRAAHWEHEWSLFGGVEPLVACFAISVASAVVLHHVVERPCERWLRAWWARKRSTTTPALAG